MKGVQFWLVKALRDNEDNDFLYRRKGKICLTDDPFGVPAPYESEEACRAAALLFQANGFPEAFACGIGTDEMEGGVAVESYVSRRPVQAEGP